MKIKIYRTNKNVRLPFSHLLPPRIRDAKACQCRGCFGLGVAWRLVCGEQRCYGHADHQRPVPWPPVLPHRQAGPVNGPANVPVQPVGQAPSHDGHGGEGAPDGAGVPCQVRAGPHAHEDSAPHAGGHDWRQVRACFV